MIFLCFLPILWIAAACRQDMHDQPRLQSLEASDFFADGSASRLPPEGTIAREWLGEDELFYTGRVNGEPAVEFPFPVTREMLARGQERFNVFCSPCHGLLGDGRGMIVQRGMRQPPSLHIVRLREAPAGHFFDVMTNGFGAMFSYASRIPPRDRWAVAGYIRALQLSQAAGYGDVSSEDLERLESALEEESEPEQEADPEERQPAEGPDQ